MIVFSSFLDTHSSMGKKTFPYLEFSEKYMHLITHEKKLIKLIFSRDTPIFAHYDVLTDKNTFVDQYIHAIKD